ncbi:MAG: trypsin-like peptidase domain-containing protein [Nocardioidaceae bacterium]
MSESDDQRPPAVPSTWPADADASPASDDLDPPAAPLAPGGETDVPSPDRGPSSSAGPTYPLSSLPPGAGWPPRRAPVLPGWFWPSLVALALVAGGLGGVLAGVAVSASMSRVTGGVAIPAADEQAASPLPVDNGSIAAVASRLLPSTVQVLSKGGSDGANGGGATGSGFVLDGRSHVITNNHVVADATGPGEIKVVDRDGRSYTATIVGRSPVYDIAVLAVRSGSRLRAAPIGASRKLRVGDTVVAIGSPLGLTSTVTSGIVSATDRPVTTGGTAGSSYINALQTDAAINPGNSGGPLANLRGQVVGVNSAIATTGGLSGESGNIGVGFAIPMEQVRITAAQILATGQARYPVIGANVDTRTRSTGAVVVDTPKSGTPAASAGLRKGDVVVGINGRPVTDGIGLIVAIRTHQPGETVALRVRRDGQERQVRVRLASKVDAD